MYCYYEYFCLILFKFFYIQIHFIFEDCPIKTLRFPIFLQILEVLSVVWRNSTPRFASLPYHSHIMIYLQLNNVQKTESCLIRQLRSCQIKLTKPKYFLDLHSDLNCTTSNNIVYHLFMQKPLRQWSRYSTYYPGFYIHEY